MSAGPGSVARAVSRIGETEIQVTAIATLGQPQKAGEQLAFAAPRTATLQPSLHAAGAVEVRDEGPFHTMRALLHTLLAECMYHVMEKQP